MNNEQKIAQLGKPSLIFGPGQQKRLNLVKKYIDLKGKRVLDVGCGIGIYSWAFFNESAEVFGIDIDKENIKKARKQAPGVRFLTSEGENLPFENDFFDIIFLNEVLEHVKDDKKTISECLRVLKPGGKIIIFAPNRFFPFETHGVYLGPHTPQAGAGASKKYIYGNIPLINWLPLKIRNIFSPHVRIYTAKSLKTLFEGNEERPRSICEVIDYVWPAFDKIERKFPKLGKILKRIASFSENNRFLKQFGISIFMIARKEI